MVYVYANLFTMSEEREEKLNQLMADLPEGLLVDAAWLEGRAIYPSLRSKYVDQGWLEQPARAVYRRPRGALKWQQAVISLQTLLEIPVVVGGRTALELQGYAHFLSQTVTEVHLYGKEKPPAWLNKLGCGARFVFHNSERLFKNDPVTRGLTSLQCNLESGQGRSRVPLQQSLTVQSWGQWDWPLTLSSPERACLELLDELPDRESFYQVDKLFDGLVSLSPRRLQKLLEDCRSVKVKRLFLFFADRHRMRWLRHLDQDKIDLGSGKRMLAKGGRLDPTYKITVPEDLDVV